MALFGLLADCSFHYCFGDHSIHIKLITTGNQVMFYDPTLHMRNPTVEENILDSQAIQFIHFTSINIINFTQRQGWRGGSEVKSTC